MKITIYCIGHLKESYWKSAVDEYLKRLSHYAKTEIVEFDDLPTPDGASVAIEDQIKSKEGVKVLARLKPSDYLIALDLGKKEYDSCSLATHLRDSFVHGGSAINFVIGGSLGLSKELKERANESITLSKMTFPHQLTRVILLEQLYRSFRILNNEPYHK